MTKQSTSQTSLMLGIIALCFGITLFAWTIAFHKTFMGYLVIVIGAPTCGVGAIFGSIAGWKGKRRAGWAVCLANVAAIVLMLTFPFHAS